MRRRAIIAEYAPIGAGHNSELARFYELDQDGRSAQKTDDFNRKLIDVYHVDTAEIQITLPAQTDGRSAAGETLVSELDKENLLNAEAAPYILRAEAVLNSDEGSVEWAQAEILSIQKEAIAKLSGDALTQFMSYTETAKSSLSFWQENYTLLSEKVHGAAPADTEGRWSWGPPIWTRLAMMAASDAAGALKGAIAGGPGAAVGAIIAGAASSAAGFASGEFRIVIPF